MLNLEPIVWDTSVRHLDTSGTESRAPKKRLISSVYSITFTSDRPGTNRPIMRFRSLMARGSIEKLNSRHDKGSPCHTPCFSVR